MTSNPPPLAPFGKPVPTAPNPNEPVPEPPQPEPAPKAETGWGEHPNLHERLDELEKEAQENRGVIARLEQEAREHHTKIEDLRYAFGHLPGGRMLP